MRELIKYIKSTTNFVTAIVSVSLSLFFWIFRPDQKVPIWCFILSMFVAFFFLWALINSLIALQQVSSIKTYTSLNVCTKEICLCEPSPLLSHGSYVTIYLIRNNCEHQIGYGEVINIQENGFLAIDIHPLSPSIVSNEAISFYEILSKYQNNIRIKPTVTRKVIDYYVQKEVLHDEKISNREN